MRTHLQRRRIKLDIFRVFGLVCLLFVTAGITFAQADPTVSIADATISEGESGDSGLFGWFFRISLSAASTKPVSVTVSTQSGSATGDVDFAAGSAVVTFNPGQTSMDLQILVKGDTAVEGTEDFFLNLSAPVNATIADGQGKGTIIDDDALLLLTQEGSARAAALDSVAATKETFRLNNSNFGALNRTRISLFAIGLNAPGEVTATGEDAQGNTQPLTVEAVNRIPDNNFLWLTQIVVRLNDQPTTGDLKIRISWHGKTSNAVPIAIQP